MELFRTDLQPHWLNRDRLFAWSRIMLAFSGLALVVMLVRSHGGVNASGKPFGNDFIAFWGASHLWWNGNPADAYDVAKLFEAQKAGLAANKIAYGWFYPPTYFLLVVPLALLPYLASLALFCCATLAAWFVALRRVLDFPGAALLILGCPVVYMNLAQGQNGLLTAAIAGAALVLLERRPVLAGALVGLLAMKPHLAVLFPLALLAGGHWRAIAAAALAAAGFAALGVLVVSPEASLAFAHSLGGARSMLESGALPWIKMPTWFALARLLGASVAAAYAVHVAVAAACAVLVGLVWRGPAALPIKAAALMTGSLLASPYLYDYDLAWLAFPMAWLGLEACRSGWLRYEREVLAAAWIVPLVLAPAAAAVQPGPLVTSALFAVVVRRAWRGWPVTTSTTCVRAMP